MGKKKVTANDGDGDTVDEDKIDLSKCPKSIDWMTCDTLAETVSGIYGTPLYRKLWDITSKAEKSGKAQPLGGDGSNGTTEVPIISNEYENNLAKAWKYFTDAERKQIIRLTNDEYDTFKEARRDEEEIGYCDGCGKEIDADDSLCIECDKAAAGYF